MSVFGVFLVSIFLHLDWIQGFTLYISIFSTIVGKCGKGKIQIRTMFMQCPVYKGDNDLHAHVPQQNNIDQKVFSQFCLSFLKRLPIETSVWLWKKLWCIKWTIDDAQNLKRRLQYIWLFEHMVLKSFEGATGLSNW